MMQVPSVKHIKSHHLILAAGLTILALMVTYMGQSPLRVLLTLPLVFVLPGYAVMAAFFPKRLASYPDNVMFVITWSLALTSLGALLLNKTPWGLHTHTWAILLGGITLVNLAIAALRHQNTYDTNTIYRLPVHQVLLLVSALLIGGVALNVAREGAAHPPGSGFTQLWMLPTDTATAVDVGIHNYEDQAETYRLIVSGTDFKIQSDFTLDKGEQWATTLELPVIRDSAQKIEARLYRLNSPDDVYRSTHLWLS
jgi:uncharacterized membrane protein